VIHTDGKKKEQVVEEILSFIDQFVDDP
jgi:hypothetical protein